MMCFSTKGILANYSLFRLYHNDIEFTFAAWLPKYKKIKLYIFKIQLIINFFICVWVCLCNSPLYGHMSNI